jgi:asparagine synthase (glutamine-hydrolysing)
MMDRGFAREGLRRLNPMRSLAACCTPDPGSAVGRLCALESAHYMRNQLLRDADWAGMAHGIEIRVPLVDTTLLRSVASLVGAIAPGQGKALLAKAPANPLPAEVVTRAKTGFAVPTGAWLADCGPSARPPAVAIESKGLASRRWSRGVLAALAPAAAAMCE